MSQRLFSVYQNENERAHSSRSKNAVTCKILQILSKYSPDKAKGYAQNDKCL